MFSFGKVSAKPNQASSDEDEPMNEQVYLQRNISAEEVDSDDLEGDMNMSDDEEHVNTRQVIKKARK